MNRIKFLKVTAVIFALLTLSFGITLFSQHGGLSASAEELAPAAMAKFEITNDTTYPWAYDSATNTYSSTNNGQKSTSAALTLNVTSAGKLTFSYLVSSERNYDKLIISVTGVPAEGGEATTTEIGAYSGVDLDHYTEHTIPSLNVGDTVTFTYSKDSSGDKGSDKAYVRLPSDSIAVSVSVKGNGTVTYNGTAATSHSFTAGTEAVTLTANPQEGHRFAYWTNDKSEILGKEAVYSLTALTPTKISAVFIADGESDIAIKELSGTPTWQTITEGESTVYRVDMAACSDNTAKINACVYGPTYLTFSSMVSVSQYESLKITVDGVQRFLDDHGYIEKTETLADLSYELHTIKIIGEGCHTVEITFNQVEAYNTGEDIRGAREVRLKDLAFTTNPETVDVQFNYNPDKGSLWIDYSGLRSLGGGSDYLYNVEDPTAKVSIPKGLKLYLLATPHSDYASTMDETKTTSSVFSGYFSAGNETISNSSWEAQNNVTWYDSAFTFYDDGYKAGAYSDKKYVGEHIVNVDIREVALPPLLIETEKTVDGAEPQIITVNNGDVMEVPYNVANSFRFRITDFPNIEESYEVLVNGEKVNIEKMGEYHGFLLSNVMAYTEVSVALTAEGYYPSAPVTFTIKPVVEGTIEQNLIDKNFAGSIQAVVNTDEKSWEFNSTVSTAKRLAYSSAIQGVNSGVTNIGFTVRGSGILQFDYMVSSESRYDLACVKIGAPLTKDDKTEANCIGASKATASGEVAWTTANVNVSQAEDATTTVYIAYLKDSSGNKGSDLVAISNVKFLQGNATVTFSSSSIGGTVKATFGDSEITSGAEVAVGSNVTYTATVNDGYVFYGWFDNGVLVSGEKSFTKTLTANVNYTAVIEAAGTYPVKMDGRLYTSINEAIASSTDGSVITLNESITLSENLTIPQGVTLLIPYSGSDVTGTSIGTTSTGTARVSWLNESKYLYLTLTLPEGVTLTVNGSLILGGVQHFPDQSGQGHTSGAYSQIINNGSITVNGVMKVYGLIKGSGSLTAESTSTLYQPFVVLNYAGGTNTSDLYSADQFPFVQFATVNIQCRQTVRFGAKVLGMTSLYFWSSVTTQDVVLVDNIANISGKEGSLIWLSEGSYIELEYSSKSVAQALGNINLTEYGLTTIKVYGNVTAGNFYLQGYGSKGMVLALPYTYNFILCEGANVVMPAGYGYKIMPGTVFTVEEGATLTVDGQLYVYDGLIQSDKSNKFYPDAAVLSKYGFSKSGNLIVNGTLSINGAFAGIVQTDGSGTVSVAANATVGEQTITDGSTGGYTDNQTIFRQSGRIYGLYGYINLEAGKSYKGFSNDAFTLESFTVDSAARCSALSVTLNQPLKGRFLEWDGENYLSTLKAYIGASVEGVKVVFGDVEGISDKDGMITVNAKLSADGLVTYYTYGYQGFTYTEAVACDNPTNLSKVVSGAIVDTTKEGTVTLREYADNGTIARDFVIFAVVSFYSQESITLPLTADEATLTGYINNATVRSEEYGLSLTTELKIDTVEMANYRTNVQNLKNATSENLVSEATSLWQAFAEMKKDLNANEIAFIEERLSAVNAYAGEIANSISVASVVYGDTTAQATVNFLNGRTETLTANYTAHGTDFVRFTVAREYQGVKYTLSANAITVTPCKVTVSINPATSVYGDDEAELTSVCEGLKYDDLAENVYTLTKNAGRNVGSYTITGQSVNPNYEITFTGGENAYTITAREITLSVADHSNIMETTTVLGNIEVTADGTCYGDKPVYTFKIYSGETLVATVDGGNLSAQLPLGTYYIEALTADPNYVAICIKKGEITVVEANDYYTVTVAFYNGNEIVTSHVYDGSVITPVATVVVKDTGAPVTQGVSVDAPVIKNAGTYSVNVSVNDATYTGLATFTVEKLQLNLSASAQTLVYNGEISAPQIIATNLVDGDVVTVVSKGTENRTVGSYTLTAQEIQGEAKDNYKLPENATVSYEIVKRPITVVINAATSVYGDNLANLTAELFENSTLGTGDNFNSLFALSVEAVNAGSYDVKGETLNQNYDITFVGGEKAYTITQRPITLGVNGVTQIYGDDEKALSVSGIIDGSLVGNDGLDGMYELVRENGLNVGSYQIKGVDKSDNYVITFTPATYTIEKRPITVLLEDVTQVYGDSETAFNFTVTQGNLCYDDTAKDLLNVVREEGYTVGSYALTATPKEGNYAVTVAYTQTNKSAYTILKRPATITVNHVQVENTVGWDGLAATIQNAYTVEGTVNNDNLNVEVYALFGSNEPLTKENFNRLFAGGAHTLTARYLNENYNVTVVSGELFVSLPGVSVQNLVSTYVYSGSEIRAFSLSNVHGALESATENTFRATYYKQGEDLPLSAMVGAGVYRMVVEIVNTDAYVWADGATTEFTVTVDKKDISEAIDVVREDKIYVVKRNGLNIPAVVNGYDVNVDVTYTLNGETVPSLESFGYYTMTVTIVDDNYQGALSENFYLVENAYVRVRDIISAKVAIPELNGEELISTINGAKTVIDNLTESDKWQVADNLEWQEAINFVNNEWVVLGKIQEIEKDIEKYPSATGKEDSLLRLIAIRNKLNDFTEGDWQVVSTHADYEKVVSDYSALWTAMRQDANNATTTLQKAYGGLLSQVLTAIAALYGAAVVIKMIFGR